MMMMMMIYFMCRCVPLRHVCLGDVSKATIGCHQYECGNANGFKFHFHDFMYCIILIIITTSSSLLRR